MFDELKTDADLSLYTDEEIALAEKIHAQNCVPNCPDGPYRGLMDAYGWLNWARRILEDRPQRETLF